jgi:hypothetical protein
MAIAPNLIMPLFNKFTPLEDESLKDRVQGLMQRAGFTAKGFFVMDGSRRSAHSNAFFTGFGASKRVVFFDTLLKQLSPAEMEAVLAHELGHFKHKHIVKMMATSFAMTLAGLALLGWLAQQVWFYTGLGVSPNLTGSNDALALVLFMLVLMRYVTRQILKKFSLWYRPTVIVGIGSNAEEAALALNSQPELGFLVQGFVDAGGAGGKTSSYFLAEQKAKMDKKWQEHDRLLGRMVLSPMYICWVPPLPSPLCLYAAVRIAAV